MRVLAALTACVLSWIAADFQTPRRQTSIAGQVVDGVTGAPIRDAVVMLVEPGVLAEENESEGVLTGADGRFDMHDVEEGAYAIRAIANGAIGAFGQHRVHGPVSTVTVADGQRVTNLRVPVWRFAEIGGTVYDADGQPLPHVEVSVVRRAVSVNSDAPNRYRIPSVFTDDRGQYTFSNICADQYIIVVPAEIETHPARLISVFETHPQTEVSFGLPRRQPSAREPLRAYLSTFAPGTTVLADAAVVSVGAGEVRRGVDVRMQVTPSARVHGRILTPIGDAIGFTLKLVRSGARDALELGDADTFSADGLFSFERVPIGHYTLAVDRVYDGDDMFNPDPLGLHARVPIDVIPEGVPELAIMLVPGVRVSGRVEFDEEPAPDAKVSLLLWLANAGVFRSIEMEKPGEFTLSGLPAGEYLVAPSANGHALLRRVTLAGRDVSGERIDVGRENLSNLVITFTNRSATVSGKVENRRDVGADATVVVFSTDSFWWADRPSSRLQTTEVEEDLGFSLDGLLPGEYFIAAIETPWLDDWPLPAFLRLLSAKATRIRLGPDDRQSVNLRIVRR